MQLLPMPTQAPFDEALLWTKIGAIGSWAGSFFGLLAFIIVNAINTFVYKRS